MSQSESVRRAILLLPGFFAFVVVLMPAPGYELPKYFAALACFTLLFASVLTRSDGIHTASMLSSASLLGLAAVPLGLVSSFAVIVSLLVVLDLANLAKSLFGVTYTRVGLDDGSTSKTYLSILRNHAVRSSGIGFVTFLVSFAIVSTPIPLLAFANPVSGSGLLALSTLLLTILVASGLDLPRRLLRRNHNPVIP
jgi:hypothetical protein